MWTVAVEGHVTVVGERGYDERADDEYERQLAPLDALLELEQAAQRQPVVEPHKQGEQRATAGAAGGCSCGVGRGVEHTDGVQVPDAEADQVQRRVGGEEEATVSRAGQRRRDPLVVASRSVDEHLEHGEESAHYGRLTRSGSTRVPVDGDVVDAGGEQVGADGGKCGTPGEARVAAIVVGVSARGECERESACGKVKVARLEGEEETEDAHARCEEELVDERARHKRRHAQVDGDGEQVAGRLLAAGVCWLLDGQVEGDNSRGHLAHTVHELQQAQVELRAHAADQSRHVEAERGERGERARDRK